MTVGGELVKHYINRHIAISKNSSLDLPVWGLASYCFEKKIEGPRNTLCDTFANKLLDNDISLSGLSLVTTIGKKNGWDAARLQTLKDERTVFEGSAINLASSANIFSCQQLDIENKWVKLSLAKGDRAILRMLVADSAKRSRNLQRNTVLLTRVWASEWASFSAMIGNATGNSNQPSQNSSIGAVSGT